MINSELWERVECFQKSLEQAFPSPPACAMKAMWNGNFTQFWHRPWSFADPFCRNVDVHRSCSPEDLCEGLGVTRAFTPDWGKPRVEAARAASKLPSSDLLQLNKSFRFLFPWGSPSCLQISQHGTPSTINNGRILLLCFPWKKKREYIKELSPSSTLSYSAYGELFLALQTWLQDNDDRVLKRL